MELKIKLQSTNKELFLIKETLENADKQMNPIFKESFTEFKIRIFNENYKKLNELMNKNLDKFVYCMIKQNGDLNTSLWLGGKKILTLYNHEIIYNDKISSQFNLFLKEYLSEGIKQPFID